MSGSPDRDGQAAGLSTARRSSSESGLVGATAGASLPRVFIAADGRDPLPPPREPVTGIFLRDTDLTTLVSVAETGRPLIAVDLDSVEGLNADIAAARFVTGRLGIGIVATRRPALAQWIADRGAVALVHVLAFDSTGLRRSLEAHPGGSVGTLLSPGPVLSHLAPEDRAALTAPLVAYGLIDGTERAWRLLEVADSVIVSRACGQAMSRAPEPRSGEATRGPTAS